MSKPLVVDQFVQLSDGRIYCVYCHFDLPSIIRAGYAPDDVIPAVVLRCVEVMMAREAVRDLGIIVPDEDEFYIDDEDDEFYIDDEDDEFLT